MKGQLKLLQKMTAGFDKDQEKLKRTQHDEVDSLQQVRQRRRRKRNFPDISFSSVE